MPLRYLNVPFVRQFRVPFRLLYSAYFHEKRAAKKNNFFEGERTFREKWGKAKQLTEKIDK